MNIEDVIKTQREDTEIKITITQTDAEAKIHGDKFSAMLGASYLMATIVRRKITQKMRSRTIWKLCCSG